MWLTSTQTKRIADMLRSNKTIRRALPDSGRLFIDRQLPFICVYRNRGGVENTGMVKMMAGQTAYLSVSGDKKHRKATSELLCCIAEIMTERFGAFLILEVWPGEMPESIPVLPPQAHFNVHIPKNSELEETTEQLQTSLCRIRTSKLSAQVQSLKTSQPAPPGILPCIPTKLLKKSGIHWIGLEITPIYIKPDSTELYPLLYRAVRRQFSRALNQTFFAFTNRHTTHRPLHFQTLGRRAMIKSVWEVDELLAKISNSFDLLKQTTPINTESAWNAFRRNHFEKPPRFLYRPRPVDPSQTKRALFSVPLERIDDPTLQRLFLDKQLEIDRELTLMTDLNSGSFKFGSLQLHGPVNPDLRKLALDLLGNSHHRRENSSRKNQVTADDFLMRVNNELDFYRRENKDFKGSARISSEMYAGMLVSQGELIIGNNSAFPESRCDALIQHEVGTHILTWSNGLAQPLKLLAAGLPRYDEFQEGLAVLAEYLCGGLDPQRIDVLAARVLAVDAMTTYSAY
jgi:uncharacterized protein (TIGR02421 family)